MVKACLARPKQFAGRGGIVVLLIVVAVAGLRLSGRSAGAQPAGWVSPEDAGFEQPQAEEEAAEEAEPPQTAACLVCHTDKSVLTKDYEELFNLGWLTSGPAELAESRPPDYKERILLDRERFYRSAHGQLDCIECHTAITTQFHTQFVPNVTCDQCHAAEQQRWNEGQHGKAFGAKDADAPDCNRCHGNYHELLPSTHTEAVIYPINGVGLCASCHGDAGILGRHPDLKADAVETYWGTIHGHGMTEAGLMIAASCASCHDHHRNLPIEDASSSMSLRQAVGTCGTCHTVVATTFTASVHGRCLFGDEPTSAPSCTSCHPGHGVIQVRTAKFQLQSVKDCGAAECHPDRLETYDLTYHGKAVAHGGLETARCADCHHFHDVQETTSPLSLVHSSRIVATCSPCHSYADERFVAFIPHLRFNDKTYPQTYYPWLFMTCLVVGTMGFFVIHSILWLIRGLADLPKRRAAMARRTAGANTGAPVYYQRFNLVHRLTHAVLFVSVIGLATTGLPLRYSETQWAQALMGVLGGVKVAGVLHRIFAALTILYAGMHFVYLWKLWRHAPKRPFWRTVFGPTSLIPNWTDVKQFFQHLRWFFFLGPHPRFGRWTYWDKFDYWAVFWGVAIIGASGAIMALSPIVARFAPGWVFNVALIIHSDEALLAASFLFAIHYFHVHLRPEKFAMDHVMFTGSLTDREMAEERPLELEQLEAERRLEERRVAAPNPTQLAADRVIAAVTLIIGLALLVALVWTEIISRLI